MIWYNTFKILFFRICFLTNTLFNWPLPLSSLFSWSFIYSSIKIRYWSIFLTIATMNYILGLYFLLVPWLLLTPAPHKIPQTLKNLMLLNKNVNANLYILNKKYIKLGLKKRYTCFFKYIYNTTLYQLLLTSICYFSLKFIC